MKKWIFVAASFCAFFLGWLFVGVAKDAYSEESYNVLFLKKEPTFKVFFVNSTLTESDVPALNLWSQDRLSELISYCRYRFGLRDYSFLALEKCAQMPYLTNHWWLDWYVGM